RGQAASEPKAVAAAVTAPGAKTTWSQRGMWTLFAFAPSMLLVAASTHITTDVASAPLLWVAPLALYLLAFIMAFMKKPLIAPRFALLFHLVLTVSALILSWTYVQWTSLLAITLLALFFGSLVCLQELHRRRPGAEGLTEFYMWMSVGGVLGGAFAALVAPVIFDTVAEYPLALALTLALRPWGAPTAKILLRLAVVATLVAGALVAVPRLMGMPIMPAFVFIGMGLMLAAMVCVQRHPFALALCALAVMGSGKVFANADNIYAARGFYGVMDVVDTTDGAYRLFTHGTTVHGVQSLDPARAHEPGGYYGPLTPIGQTFRVLTDAGRLDDVVVLGLGVGAMSCYATPQQNWTFYEIDPMVVDVAMNPELFTLVSGCAPQAQLLVGDGRLLLQEEPAGSVDLLLVDAFSSDAVPTHLLTREAMSLYLSRLSETGVAMIHISNRNLALSDIVGRTARAAGAVMIQRQFTNPVQEGGPDRWANLTSHAILIARSDAALAPLMATGQWSLMSPSDRPVWTDDYTNILEPLMTRMAEAKGN
ncbi:MAG: spermidine synthase, partial [Caulobacterales bacterium]